MYKWYQWFYLSICFAIGGVINYFNGKGITAAIAQYFLQLFSSYATVKAKKAGKYLSISVS